MVSEVPRRLRHVSFSKPLYKVVDGIPQFPRVVKQKLKSILKNADEKSVDRRRNPFTLGDQSPKRPVRKPSIDRFSSHSYSSASTVKTSNVRRESARDGATLFSLLQPPLEDSAEPLDFPFLETDKGYFGGESEGAESTDQDSESDHDSDLIDERDTLSRILPLKKSRFGKTNSPQDSRTDMESDINSEKEPAQSLKQAFQKDTENLESDENSDIMDSEIEMDSDINSLGDIKEIPRQITVPQDGSEKVAESTKNAEYDADRNAEYDVERNAEYDADRNAEYDAMRLRNGII